MVKMRLHLGLVGFVVGLVGVTGCGRGAPNGGNDDLGRVQIALMGVPADGTCVRVLAAGYRTVSHSFSAEAGGSQVFAMTGLPVGQVTFTAEAFGGSCPPASAESPNWVSDAPFTTTVTISPPALVTLNLVRNGSAKVAIGFNDGPDGGAAQPDGGVAQPDGGSGTGGTGGNPAGGAFQTASYMQLPNVTGESQAPGFEGWFDITNFTLTTVTPTSAGSGGGAGKPQWTASAILKFQKGTPALYDIGATHRILPTVLFAVQASASNGTLHTVWEAKLQNVTVTSVKSIEWSGASTQSVPSEHVEFTFQRIDLTFAQRKPDGTPGPSIMGSWDLAQNQGSGPPRPASLQFALGGAAAEPPWKSISAFRAPSELTPVTPSGQATGRTTFSDASVTFLTEPLALSLLMTELTGLNTPTGTVEIRTTGGDGATSTLGSYGFKNVAITGVTLSGLDATVLFRAMGFSWTFGNEIKTFENAVP